MTSPWRTRKTILAAVFVLGMSPAAAQPADPPAALANNGWHLIGALTQAGKTFRFQLLLSEHDGTVTGLARIEGGGRIGEISVGGKVEGPSLLLHIPSQLFT